MAHTISTRPRRIAALLALAAAMALALLSAMALSGGGPTSARAAVKHATRHATVARDTDNAQVGDQTSPDPARPAGRAAASDPAGGSEAGGAESGSAASEPGTESEQGLPGEPAAGHADPAGSAGSDCTGNCVQ